MKLFRSLAVSFGGAVLLGVLPVTIHADFDPYQLNGGLVAGVAGRDYCVLAADTRLTGPSGFEILQRQHTTSRLWSMLPSPLAAATQRELRQYAKQSASRIERELDEYKEETEDLRAVTENDSPVWVGSVGCSTDCEELKRQLQGLIRRNLRTGELSMTQKSLPASLAILLGQILYSRRAFPYYAFCVLAGCNASGGHVYGYDAIGSYERLAVAVSGQGRDILQSILDRSFHSQSFEEEAGGEPSKHGVIRRVVRTPKQVTETAEEAKRILVDGFRAVAKREASVGDSVVVLCWRYSADGHCIQPSIAFASLPEN